MTDARDVSVPTTPTNPTDGQNAELRDAIALRLALNYQDEAKYYLDEADDALSVVGPVLEGLRAEVERHRQAGIEAAARHLDEMAELRQRYESARSQLGGLYSSTNDLRKQRDSERESRIAWALEADRLQQEREALSSLLRGMARRATKLRRGMRGHEARIAHLVSRPSVSNQTPATPDAEPATVSLCGVPHRISCNLVTEADEQWCTCDGPQRVGEALLDRLNGLSSVQGDTTPEEACVHGQTADLTGLAARENRSDR